MVAKKFQIHVLRLLENKFVSQKIESVYSRPRAKLSPRFLSSSFQAEGNYPFPQQIGEDCGAENMTKIKLARVLVTSFDKFHHLQPLHFWFLFCCVMI